MTLQTAVEWLENQIKISKYYYNLMEDIQSRSTVAQPNIFEQAKEMEKEQIINAWIATDNELQRISAEKYYNETFNQNPTLK